MVINVKVNYPENREELEEKASKALAKILVNKLQPKGIEQLIEIMKRDDFKVKF